MLSTDLNNARYNIESILGLIRAAEAKKAPLILQFFPWAITYSDGLLIHAGAHYARKASVPVSIHLVSLISSSNSQA